MINKLLIIVPLIFLSSLGVSENKKELITPGPSLSFFEESVTQAISSGNEENLRYLLGEFGLHCGARHLAAKNLNICEKDTDCIKQLDQIFGYERDLSLAMMKIDNEGLSLSKIEDLVDTQLVQKSATIQLWILNQREGGNSYSSSFLFSEELMGCAEMSLNLRENLKLF